MKKSEELYNLFIDLDKMDDNAVLMHIQNLKAKGLSFKMNIDKSALIDFIYNAYSDARLIEFKESLSKSKVKNKDIAEKLGVHKDKFSQLLSGFIKSTKGIESTLDFVNKAEKILFSCSE